jgi:hypothetical protein
VSSVVRISHTGEFLSRFRQAQAAGLIAGGNVIRNAVRRELRGGYRSTLGHHGDFVTGNSINHVTISEPRFTADGGSVTVGTDLLYNLYWELGHHNLFTRHFERDEKWRPAFMGSKDAARTAFIRVMRRTLFQGAR